MKTTKKTGIVKNQSEIAAHFGVSTQTITKWVQRGMPGRHGKWDIGKIAAWLETRKRERAEFSDLKEEEVRARIRKLEAEATAKEYENRVTEGLLVYRDDVEQEVSEHIIFARSTLDRIPDAVRLELPIEVREPITQLIRNMIHAALVAISEWTPTVSSPGENKA